ncbi:MAG TPA: glycosyltransferase family 9 protein [Candidatus Krumholzibacteria bacterium]|nr:glycosyltransferase family 9 protein [Candidatus Krumholzibacteria bacterium]
MAEPRRVLILRRRAVGDIVVSLPMVHALRELWPGAKLSLVVDRMAAELIEHSGAADEVLVYDPPESGAARVLYDLKWLRNLRAVRYELTIDLLGTPQSAQWTRLIGSPLRVGRSKRYRSWAYNYLLERREGAPRFAGEEVLDFARALGARTSNWQPARLLKEGDSGPSDPPPPGSGAWVILHAPASWSAKAWPQRHWVELVRRLAAAGVERIEISWGPGEEGWRDAILEESGTLAKAMPPTTLLELTRRISRCDLLVAVDSGPAHIAMAEGTPTLTLFGSTNERGWHHSAPRHRALVHEVECRPCDLTVCPVPGHPCLELLEPEYVCTQALELLAQGRR